MPAYKHWVLDLGILIRSSIGGYLVRSASINGPTLNVKDAFNSTSSLQVIGVAGAVTILKVNHATQVYVKNAPRQLGYQNPAHQVYRPYHLPSPPVKQFVSSRGGLQLRRNQPGVAFNARRDDLALSSDKWDVPLSFVFESNTGADGGYTPRVVVCGWVPVQTVRQ
jgi:hypothetical protein